MSYILNIHLPGGCKIISYADDLAIISTGRHCLGETERCLDLVSKCGRTELKITEDKGHGCETCAIFSDGNEGVPKFCLVIGDETPLSSTHSCDIKRNGRGINVHGTSLRVQGMDLK